MKLICTNFHAHVIASLFVNSNVGCKFAQTLAAYHHLEAAGCWAADISCVAPHQPAGKVHCNLPNLTQSRPLSGKSALSKHISPNFRTCRMFHLFISPCHGASYQLIINPCINWRLRLQLKYFFLFLDVSNSQFQRTLQNAWTRILA